MVHEVNMLSLLENDLSYSMPPGIDGKAKATDLTSGEIIRIEEFLAAAERIAPYIKRTPTLIDTYLSRRFDSNVYLKHELLQRTAAFKVRGAFNKLLLLSDAEKEKGVVAVSAGNHAQAVAYAAKQLGIRALILMPADTPQIYVEKTLGYDADVEFFATIADAFDAGLEYRLKGSTLVHPFDDRDVVVGQGTIGLEILDDVPDVTDIVVSVGGGGLAGGVAAAAKLLKPSVRIWGVETFGAHSMSAALAAGKVVQLDAITSIARTLGAPKVGELNYLLARDLLSSVTVVSDGEAVNELFCLLDKAKVLTEPATSCTLAAAEKLKANFGPESHVVLVLCGGNIGLNDLFALKKDAFEQ